MMYRKMTKRPQEYSKTHLTPKKRVCRDDPNDYVQVSMANRLKQGTFLIPLFIFKKLKFTRLLFSGGDLLSNFIIELCYRTVNIVVVI